MKKEDLIPIIARQDPLLANAVSHMIDYIQDRTRPKNRRKR